MKIVEDRKLTEQDLDVLACAGSSVTLARVRAMTRMSDHDIYEALDRALDVLPHYQSTLLQQATDSTRSAHERRMALNASRSVTTVIAWVYSLLPAPRRIAA